MLMPNLNLIPKNNQYKNGNRNFRLKGKNIDIGIKGNSTNKR